MPCAVTTASRSCAGSSMRSSCWDDNSTRRSPSACARSASRLRWDFDGGTESVMNADDDSNSLTRVVERCLDEARVRGAAEAEAAASVDDGLSVGVRLGEVETVEYQ